ncbi:MAG: helix-turn-helix protein [Pseudomonadota bacterium]|jgi:transcriptional regulator with XRE-family HTH domain
MQLTTLLASREGSQTELAVKVGVSQGAISSWERGAHLPPSTRLPALARALGVPLRELRRVVAADRAARQAATP